MDLRVSYEISDFLGCIPILENLHDKEPLFAHADALRKSRQKIEEGLVIILRPNLFSILILSKIKLERVQDKSTLLTTRSIIHVR